MKVVHLELDLVLIFFNNWIGGKNNVKICKPFGGSVTRWDILRYQDIVSLNLI